MVEIAEHRGIKVRALGLHENDIEIETRVAIKSCINEPVFISEGQVFFASTACLQRFRYL